MCEYVIPYDDLYDVDPTNCGWDTLDPIFSNVPGSVLWSKDGRYHFLSVNGPLGTVGFKMVLPCTNTAQDAGIQYWTQKTRACSPISNHQRGWNPCSPGSQVLGYRDQVTSGYHSGRVHCRSGTRVSIVLWWSAASWCTIVLRLVTVDWWQIRLQLSLDICTWNW